MSNMTNPVSTSSADANREMNSEFVETPENLEQMPFNVSICEKDIRKSLKSLSKYQRAFCDEFEATLQKSILNFLCLESELAQMNGLQQVHFSNAASGEEQSTAATHEDESNSPSTSNGTRQRSIDQINIVVNVQSHLSSLENEIRLNQNLLAEMKDPIYMLKTNITRLHREVKMRLQSYFRNNKEDRDKQIHKNTELEEKLLQAIREINDLRNLTEELEQELKNRTDKLKELELKFASQQTNPEGDQVDHEVNSAIDRSTNVPYAHIETDFSRESSPHPQNLQTTGTTSQQSSSVLESTNNGFVIPPTKLNTYKHLLAALQSNQKLGQQLQKYEEINKEQKKRIAELEEIRINDQKESNTLNDLVEAFEQEMKLKNNQLECQQEMLTHIQGKLKSAEDQLNQLRCVSKVEEDSTVQVLPDIQPDEVSKASEDDVEELPQSRQDQNSSTFLIMDDMSNNELKDIEQYSLDVNQSNERSEEDVDRTDTAVVSEIVLDQEIHDQLIFQRKEEEMQNEITDLKENYFKLQQMLVDAEEMNHTLRKDIMNIEQKKDDAINTLHRLNEHLEKNLEQKDRQLDMQRKEIADIQEKLESAEQTLRRPTDELVMEDQALLNIYSQTKRSIQYFEEQIEQLEVKAAVQDAGLERLKQKCKAYEDTSVFISNLVEGLKSQLNDKSKKHLNDHEMINLITELNKIRKFLATMRIDQSNTKKTFQILRSEIDYLRKNKLIVEQESDNIQTSEINQLSSKDTNDSTESRYHKPSRSVSSCEHEQETFQCISKMLQDLSSLESTEVLFPLCTDFQKMDKNLQKQEENRIEDCNTRVGNHEETKYNGSPKFSVSGASTSTYFYPQLTGISNEKMASRGNSFDVVNIFLNSERAAQSNEEESKGMFGDDQQTLLPPSEGVVEARGAKKGNCREILENGSTTAFTNFYSDQNINSQYKRALLLKKMRSGAPFTSWDGPTLGIWLEQWVGMPSSYVSICRANVKSGEIMCSLTDEQIKKELFMKNPLHKLKLRVAIQEMMSSTIYPSLTITRATLAFRELNHRWIGKYWLPSLGLSKYQNRFMDCLVDARMLNHLTEDHLKDQLKMKNRFHRISLHCGITCLKIFGYDHCLLEERRKMCENIVSDVLVWTNERVIKWIASIGLEAWAHNLKESGLHGAIIALNNGFDASNMASLLRIHKRNVVARRKLELHFNNLIQNATDRFQDGAMKPNSRKSEI
ncbi:hypothetical protein WA026_015967 [Henosepilachna vigintioctopunctata]|uniref:SAM domain-containing protein n=1 Tax=Henosepilachna vigintioctopunctata TaxID=420089 RepID=A0AAW1U8J3_9CUCU